MHKLYNLSTSLKVNEYIIKQPSDYTLWFLYLNFGEKSLVYNNTY